MSKRWWMLMQFAFAMVALVVAISYAVLAVTHANDRYRVDFVSGTWMALASYASEGTLFPPAYADGHYGGTRYMPFPVLLHAAASEATGEFLMSGKAVTYLITASLFLVAFLVLRLVGCPTLLSAALLSAVLVTPVGLLVTLGIRYDSLSAAFQLGAVALVLRRQTRTSVIAAGLLSTLAIMSKASAIWGPAAIAIWLFQNTRSRARLFVAAFGLSLALAVMALEFVSDGRFLASIADFAFAGNRGPSGLFAEGPRTLLAKFSTYADAVWLLFPLALVSMLVSVRSPRLTLLQLALLADLVVVTVVFASRGTDFNHLIDLCLLTVLVVGEFAPREAEGRPQLMTLLVGVAVVWGVASSYQHMMGPETVGAVRRLTQGASATNPAFEPNPLAGLVRADDSILSEDPTIPLTLGQRPVLLDAFTARAALAKHPQWAHLLAARIRAKEFDEVILVSGLSPDGYGDQFLGRIVNEAIGANYRQIYAEVNLYVYVPRRVEPR